MAIAAQFDRKPPSIGSDDQRSSVHVKCCHCPNELVIHQHRRSSLPFDAVKRMITREGWTLGNNRNRDKCSHCNGLLKKKDRNMPKTSQVLPLPVSSPDHIPDDIDREIFARLDRLQQEAQDSKAAQELLMERNEQLYEGMLSIIEGQRKLNDSTNDLARLVYEDSEASRPISNPVRILTPTPPQSRITYGKNGNTRRVTPLPKVTVRNWDNIGVKIRVSRKVWDEAGMPIHEGTIVVVEPGDGFFTIRAAVEDDKGVGLWRINDQSIHLKTRSFTTTSSHNPDVRSLRAGSITIGRE